MTKPLATAYVACCAAAWLSFVYNSIRMACSLHPPPPGPPGGRREPYHNRLNAIFYPADLTPKGQRYRKQTLFSMVVFFGLLWLGVVLMAAT